MSPPHVLTPTHPHTLTPTLPPHSYMFDEPSSYLDVKQRLKAAEAIRNLLSANMCVDNTHTRKWLVPYDVELPQAESKQVIVPCHYYMGRHVIGC